MSSASGIRVLWYVQIPVQAGIPFPTTCWNLPIITLCIIGLWPIETCAAMAAFDIAYEDIVHRQRETSKTLDDYLDLPGKRRALTSNRMLRQ